MIEWLRGGCLAAAWGARAGAVGHDGVGARGVVGWGAPGMVMRVVVVVVVVEVRDG